MTTNKRKFGEILVANGTISEKTLQRSLAKAKKEKKKIGVILEDMGIATGEEIAAALAEQFGCRTVRDFAGYSYAPELLAFITVDIATQYSLFPLKIDDNTPLPAAGNDAAGVQKRTAEATPDSIESSSRLQRKPRAALRDAPDETPAGGPDAR